MQIYGRVTASPPNEGGWPAGFGAHLPCPASETIDPGREISMKHEMRLALALLLPGVAAAQDNSAQTPENARKFISIISENGGISIDFDNNYVQEDIYNYRTQQNFRKEIDRATWITPMSFSNNCTIILSNDNYSVYIPDGYKTYGSDKMYDLGYSYIYIGVHDVKKLKDSGISMKSVGSIEARGSSVSISGSTVSGLRLIFKSPEMATRATYALNVIKQSCDPTAATGF